MKTAELIRENLLKIIKDMAEKKKSKLTELKNEHKNLERPDFIWHYLLQSFSTMGNSRGWHGLICNPNNYKKVRFIALAELNPQQRLSVLERVLADAKVRMPLKKAQWLAGNYDYINSLGGLKLAKEKLLNIPGKEAKIAFLKTFDGIGDKYARNIMMDVYHEDFRNSIAIDDRIKTISNELGLSFTTYKEHEEFYLKIAHEAGMNGWELDRLMYNFKDEILERLRGKSIFEPVVIRRRPAKCKQ